MILRRNSLNHRYLFFAFALTTLLAWRGLFLTGAHQRVRAAPAVPGSISGVVRDVTGALVGGIELRLYRNTSLANTLQRTATDANGTYTFSLLSAGLYRIALEDAATRYPSPQYYRDAVGLNDATDIVVAGAHVTGIDMVLHAGGQLRGRVTGVAGSPLADVEVLAYQRGHSSRVAQRAVTDSTGNYVVTALASGFYYLEYRDLSHRYYTTFYGNAESYGDSIPVGVSAGGVVDQLDISLARGGNIRGQVKNANGMPLANITVHAQLYYGYYTVVTTTADENGRYSLGPLTANTYRINFVDLTQRYAPQIYNNAEFLTEAGVLVETGQEVTGIDVTMVKHAAAQGVVTAQDGAPLAGILVSAFGEHAYASSSSTHTDTQGGYLLEGLVPDRYRVEFSDPEGLYLRKYYSNVTSLSAATWITAFPTAIITNVNASLTIGGAITGTIKTEDDSALSALYIRVIPQSALVAETPMRYTYTVAAHYTYTIGGLLPGAYLVQVISSRYFEYYNDVTVDKWATPVTVTAGQFTRDTNFVLGDAADAATISGTVHAPDGQPLPGIAVRPYCLDCPTPPIPAPVTIYAPITTDSHGQYRVTGLTPGRYRLRFGTYTGLNNANYAFEYYDDAIDLASATDLELTPRLQRGGIDATLGPGGTMTGKITLDDGSPLRDGLVGLYFWDGYTWVELGSVAVDALTGEYVRPFLQTGTYRTEVHGYLGRFFRYFYGNTTVLTNAIDIAVTAGITVPDINITLPVAAFLNAGVTGTVTANGQPVAGIRVDLYAYYANDVPVIYSTTDAAGRYAFGNLSAGSYFVSFVDPTGAYAVAYSNHARTFEAANNAAFGLDDNEIITNVNAALEAGGAISGRILDLLGKGASQIEVEAKIKVDGKWVQVVAIVQSDSQGRYIIHGLPSGAYRLYFSDPIERYSSRYYGDVQSVEASPDIAVVTGATTADINVMMATTVPALNRRVLLPFVAR